MKKRFNSRKKQFFKLKFILFIIAVLLSFGSSFKFLYKRFKSQVKDKDIINYLLYGASNNNYEDFYNLNSTEFLVKYSLGLSLNKINGNEINQDLQGDYIEEPNTDKMDKPIVYIYNTHQTEGYNKNIVTAYNITPSVMLASYMLRERLNDLGIPTIVETTNIKEVLNNHNWIYKDSYKASRILLENAYQNNDTLKLFIDIHRDSSVYEKTTYQKDNNSYAKVLFVVGLEYNGYEKNLNNATKLNDILNHDFPGISRGVLKKGGKGVNGIYNQDFKNNVLLIEIGGQYNSIEEVKNTIEMVWNRLKQQSDYNEEET